VLAGHPQPVLVRANGSTELVGEYGTAVGLTTELRLTATRHELAAGDTLLAYTDGVTERRAGREQFGPDRLLAAARTAVANQRPSSSPPSAPPSRPSPTHPAATTSPYSPSAPPRSPSHRPEPPPCLEPSHLSRAAALVAAIGHDSSHLSCLFPTTSPTCRA